MKRFLLLAAICTAWCSIDLEATSSPPARAAADSNEGETRFLPKGYKKPASVTKTPSTPAAKARKTEVVYKTVGDIQLKLHI